MKTKFSPLNLVLVLLALWLAPPQADAGTPDWQSQMNYQGLLTDISGTAVADGSYNVTFVIYNDPVAGTVIWGPETQSVNTNKGLFNVYLGQISPLPQLSAAQINSDYYLSVQISGEAAEMLPRQKLLPAFFARTAFTLQGLVPNNSANNLVVLDGAGKIPAGLVAGGSASVPFDVTGMGGSYAIRGYNQSAGPGTYGVWGQGQAAGIYGVADIASGNGVQGQTFGGADLATSAGVRGIATNGYGVYGTASTAGGFGGFFEGTGLGIAVKGQAPAGVTFGTLGDKINDAGAYGEGGAGSHGVKGTTSGAFKYGVSGSNTNGGTGVYGSGEKGVYASGVGYGVHGVASTYGGYFEVTSPSYGVYATTPNGGIGVTGIGTWGVRGIAGFAGGRGVYGDGGSNGQGVYATNSSTSYQAIYGNNTTGTSIYGTTGATSYYGVEGRNTGLTGVGIYGFHTSTGAGVGVRGESAGTSGRGVHGRATGATSQGVHGETTLAGAKGVFGENTNITPNSSTYGVHGKLAAGASAGYGVYGENGEAGVYGTSSGFAGVWGMNATNYGVVADSNYDAIWARMNGSGFGYGIYVSFAGSGGSGIYLNAGNAGAGYYGVNVDFSGTGSAAGRFNSMATTGTKYAVQGIEASTAANAAGGRFESTGASGAVYGVYGQANLSNGSSVGVYGSGGNYGVQAVGGTYGVYSSGTYTGVYGSGPSFGVWGAGGSYGVYGTSSSINAVLGEHSGTGSGAAGRFYAYSGTGSVYGVSAQATGNGLTYGVYGNNSNPSNAGHAIYGLNAGTGLATAGVFGEGQTGVRAKGLYYGLYIEPTSTTNYGIFYQQTAGDPSSYGVYSYNYCATCYGGYFSNTSGTAVGGGQGLYVLGRVYMGTVAGIITYNAGVTSQVFSDIYIDSTDEVMLTPKSDPGARYWISAIATGSFTVSMNLAPISAVTFSYLIVGD